MIHSVTKYQEKLRTKSEVLNPTPNLSQIKLLSTHYFPLVNREIIILLELIYLIIITGVTEQHWCVCWFWQWVPAGCWEQSSVCTRPVVTVAPGSGHCHPTLSLLLGLWALPISSLAPAPSSLQVLSGVFRGASPQVLQGAQEMCARNVVGFMFPSLPILFWVRVSHWGIRSYFWVYLVWQLC